MAAASQSIREIVLSQPGAEAILERFDIDMQAHANLSLHETCRDLQLSVEQVLEKLEDAAALHAGANCPDPATLSPSRLIQHIVRVHHRNVREKLPQLVERSHSLVRQHRESMPELEQIGSALEELHSDLQQHLRKEEGVLFPYIAQIDEASPFVFRPAHACFRRVGEPVFVMVQEHERAGLLLAELRRLTNGFEAPEEGPPAIVAFYAGLREFSENLREHIRLENDVLFPRAVAREAELFEEGAR